MHDADFDRLSVSVPWNGSRLMAIRGDEEAEDAAEYLLTSSPAFRGFPAKNLNRGIF